jgi:hypothetical protein
MADGPVGTWPVQPEAYGAGWRATTAPSETQAAQRGGSTMSDSGAWHEKVQGQQEAIDKKKSSGK